jgi:hypothetical protein
MGKQVNRKSQSRLNPGAVKYFERYSCGLAQSKLSSETAGENDGRVLAYHSRKMTVSPQTASGSGRPILLQTNTSGHGIGTPLAEQIAEGAAVFAFFASQLEG